jgi:uncharacterized protein DUF3309
MTRFSTASVALSRSGEIGGLPQKRRFRSLRLPAVTGQNDPKRSLLTTQPDDQATGKQTFEPDFCRVRPCGKIDAREPCCHGRLKTRGWCSSAPESGKDSTMSLGLLLVIILVIALLGGFSGRFGGYGYGYGHGGVGVLGIILIILVVLLLTGRL